MTEDEDRSGRTTSGTGVGHGRPPVASRFAKGVSGNPRGRPRGRHREPPYEAVLGQIVTIRDGSTERRVTAAEAFLLQLTKRALEGDGVAGGATMELIEAQKDRPESWKDTTINITRVIVSPKSVTQAVLPLKIARKLDPYRPTARLMLEPWIVEAALARLGSRRFTREEQQTIVEATRTPHRVRWPEWWEVRPARGA
jgi:hypothetical protein